MFELYGPGAKAANESSFRGFVALDVRNYESTTSRVYYNGVTSGTNELTLKNKEGIPPHRLSRTDVPAHHQPGGPR